MKKTALLMAALVAGTAAAATWPDLSRPFPARGGGEKDAAVVIGLETYAFVGKVPGAADNARAWYAHLTKTVGIPPSRVALLLDADAALESMRRAARDAASQVKPGGTLWFVYIGHGAPSEDGKDGVLVGVDAQQSVESLYSRSLRQKELLGLLAAGKQEQTLVLLDACFSGRGAEGAYLAPGLQPLLPVAKTAYAAMKKTVVLTAGTSKQFAGPLPGANRPAFSYLMLGAMRGWGDANKDGVVTAAEAVEYSGDALKALLKGRQQSPEANPEASGALVLAAFEKGKGEEGPDLADLVLGNSGGAALPEAKAPPTVEPAQPKPANDEAATGRRGEGCPVGMASVPGGSFKMGDRGDQVTVAGFCMDVTEVTVAAYAACVGTGGCTAAEPGGDCNAAMPGRQNHPITCVEWTQSDAFCKAQGKRLPTEEEWEWAARGGEKGTTFPWGNEAPGRRACWDGEGNDLGMRNRKNTCPVGSYPSGDAPPGIHDLAGNVWEWTATVHGAGPDRVCRGGSWGFSDPSFVRAAVRRWYPPTYRNNSLGFRCARTP